MDRLDSGVVQVLPAEGAGVREQLNGSCDDC